MAAIPLSWNDPMFSGVTSSGSVTLRDGGTLSNKSITDSGNIASVVGQWLVYCKPGPHRFERRRASRGRWRHRHQ